MILSAVLGAALSRAGHDQVSTRGLKEMFWNLRIAKRKLRRMRSLIF